MFYMCIISKSTVGHYIISCYRYALKIYLHVSVKNIANYLSNNFKRISTLSYLYGPNILLYQLEYCRFSYNLSRTYVVKEIGHFLIFCQMLLLLCNARKNVSVLVIGRVDFDANKKNAGRKITQDTVFTCQTSTINSFRPIQKHVVTPILTSKIRYYYVLPALLCFLEYGKCFLKLHLILNNSRYQTSSSDWTSH